MFLGVVEIVVVAFKLFLCLLEIKREKDVTTRKRKEEGLKDVLEGIKNKDASAITSGFDRINRVL